MRRRRNVLFTAERKDDFFSFIPPSLTAKLSRIGLLLILRTLIVRMPGMRPEAKGMSTKLRLDYNNSAVYTRSTNTLFLFFFFFSRFLFVTE